MKILVVNAGSSSLKYQLIEMDNESVLAKGVCERIGQENAVLVHKGSKEVRIEKPMPTHKEAMQLVLAALVDKEYGVIGSMSEIAAVGHRVLHSGEDFKESVLIKDDEVLEENRRKYRTRTAAHACKRNGNKGMQGSYALGSASCCFRYDFPFDYAGLCLHVRNPLRGLQEV